MCFLSDSLEGVCQLSSGGVSRLLFANYNQHVWDNINFNEEKTLVNDILIGLVWYEFPIADELVEFKEAQVDTAQGKMIEQTINWGVGKMELAKARVIKELRTAKLIAIHRDRNARYWITGLYTPYRCVEYTAGTGTIKGENVYNLVFRSVGIHQAYEVNSLYIDKVDGNEGGGEFNQEEFNDGFNII